MASVPWPMRGTAGLLPDWEDPAAAAWPVTLDGCACAAQASETVRAASIAAATRAVFDLFSRRWTGCRVAVARWVNPYRPCVWSPAGPDGRSYWPLRLDEAFAYPLRRVVAVRVTDLAGATTTLASALWRVDPPEALVLNRGSAAWLAAQPHLLQYPDRQVGDPGTWWVEALTGEDPPPLALRAASDLACELVRAVVDPENSRLPDGVRSVTRRGTTITFDGPEQGSTGVPSLDLLLTQYPSAAGRESATAGDGNVRRRALPGRQAAADPAQPLAGMWVPVDPAAVPGLVAACSLTAVAALASGAPTADGAAL